MMRRIVYWMVFLAVAVVQPSEGEDAVAQKAGVKVIYPKKTVLKFDGMNLEGELKNPGEFYFQHRPGEKFESLIKRRTQFHRQMLRDVVHSK